MNENTEVQPNDSFQLTAPKTPADLIQAKKDLEAHTAQAITELKATEVFLRESGLSKGPVDIDKLFDTSYLGLAGLH